MDIQYKPLSDINPYQKNAKKHSQKQIEQIAASIQEFGFNQPIVVDENNTIIVGHGRYEAAKFLGRVNVPVLTVQISEEQAKAYRLADNKLNESEWDMDLVIPELKELSVPMLELTGFDKSELEDKKEYPPPAEVNVSATAKPKCTVCGELVMCESCDNANL